MSCTRVKTPTFWMTPALVLGVILAVAPAGAQTYVSQWDANGVPLNLASPTTIASQTIQAINLAIPESQDVRITHPEYIATDSQVRVSFSDSADVYVTFIHEGAGYRNTFGCFLYDTENPPETTEGITKEVLFPNTSYQNSGGGLNTGDTVFAGRHGPGTTMGFWLNANAWQSGSQSFSDGYWRHWSVRDLNQETEEDLRPHMVLLAIDGENLILGFEDILRSQPGCDQDFNDVVFMVRADPPEALNFNEVTELPGSSDSDGDGVADYDDAFPSDPDRAAVQYTPSVSSREVIAFEDKWPMFGDYDFNDLVVRYQFRESLDAAGDVKEIRAYLDPLARGASHHNGFAIQLPIPTSAVDTVRAYQAGVEIDASGILETGNGDETVLVIFDDAHDVLPSTSGYTFANTEAGSPLVEADRIEVQVIFNQTVARSEIGMPPYNPFIFRTGSRGHEIHLLDQPPSSQAIVSYFGSGDDASDPDSGQYYRDSRGFPWAMILPENWQHPLELREITMGYTRFDDWVVSNGDSYSNWPETGRNLSHIWTP